MTLPINPENAGLENKLPDTTFIDPVSASERVIRYYIAMVYKGSKQKAMVAYNVLTNMLQQAAGAAAQLSSEISPKDPANITNDPLIREMEAAVRTYKTKIAE